MSRRIVAVAVVALVVLAGCTGGSVDGTTTSHKSEETTTAALSAATDQPWVAANESITADALLETHNAVLANASSYEFSQRLDSSRSGTTETTIAVNRERERALLSISVPSEQDGMERIQETFVADGTLYSKSGTPGDPNYGRQDENMTGTDFQRFVDQQSRLETTGGVLDAFEFEYVGVDDGAYVFEADSVRPSEETSFDAENVTAASGRLVVDEAGYIHEMTLSLTVDTAEGEQDAALNVTTTGVNETTVSEPSWTENV